MAKEDYDYPNNNQDNIDETEDLLDGELIDDDDLLPVLVGEEVREEVGEIFHSLHLENLREADPGWTRPL